MLRVAELELEAEEGAVEEGAEDVGREVRPRQRPLAHVDQVEGVEVADEGQDRDDADRRQDERQLDLPELRHAGHAVGSAASITLVGDRQEGRIDQHHRDADELPDRDQRQRVSAYSSAEPGLEQAASSPTASSIEGAMPQIGDRISFQAKPTITKLRIVGTKMAVR
jgi:hypothetical protein